jgi:hypothetical protein
LLVRGQKEAILVTAGGVPASTESDSPGKMPKGIVNEPLDPHLVRPGLIGRQRLDLRDETEVLGIEIDAN